MTLITFLLVSVGLIGIFLFLYAELFLLKVPFNEVIRRKSRAKTTEAPDKEFAESTAEIQKLVENLEQAKRDIAASQSGIFGDPLKTIYRDAALINVLAANWSRDSDKASMARLAAKKSLLSSKHADEYLYASLIDKALADNVPSQVLNLALMRSHSPDELQRQLSDELKKWLEGFTATIETSVLGSKPGKRSSKVSEGSKQNR